MLPVISAVICTYNRSRLLGDALESLAQQTISADLLEVVVVDNNSTDDTVAVADRFQERFRHYQSLREERQGLSHARNCGLQACRGVYVAFLDDDACAEPDWCERVLTAFSTVKPAPASIGGKILPRYETAPPVWFVDDFEVRSWGDTACFLSGYWGQFGFSGSNMAFPRELLIRFGGFRTDLGMIGGKLRLGEEKDLYFRIHQELPRFWYDPQITVRHWVPVDHMRVSYLLRRSFMAGKSRAVIQSCQRFSAAHFDEFKGLGGTVKELLGSVLPSGSGYRAELVKKLCRVSHQLGVLLGAG
jgi:glycosyltransferase involved in cell wall biosynthesis